MNKHKQERSVILRDARYIPHCKPNRRKKSRITESDYWPVPVPVNIRPQPLGDCLIWIGPLTKDGYGSATFPANLTRAHVQAYKQSRGTHPSPGKVICHLCHRPYCVQPSHLYEGDKRTNAQDLNLKKGKASLSLMFKRHDEVINAARYQWSSSRSTPHTGLLLEPDTIPVDHICEFTIPAGDYRICATCEAPEDPAIPITPTPKRLQAENTDRNAHTSTLFQKSVNDMGHGITLVSNLQADISYPATRAEKRRRKRATTKMADKAKPILIGKTTFAVQTNGEPISAQFDQPFTAPCDGILVVTASIKPLPQSLYEPH